MTRRVELEEHLTPLRLDGIVRVSNVGEREYLRSPEQQRRDLESWAAAQGHELAMVHVAIDQSARKGSHPAIEAAKARALAGEVDGIVAPYLSRFTRNTLYGLQTIQELLAAGARFFSLDLEGIDLQSPQGKKLLTRELADAEYESDVRAAHFQRGVKEAIERGVNLAVPYGYRRSAGKGTALEPDEPAASVVRRAYELRAQGHSWSAIADQLNAIDRLRRWNHKTARQTVHQDVYLGQAKSGQHVQERAHPALVSAKLAEQARRTRGTRPKAGPRHLLAGIVRCSGCGYAMTYQRRPAGSGGLLADRGYYRCRDQARVGCPGVNVPAAALEELAEGVLRAYLAHDAVTLDGEGLGAAAAAVDQAERHLARMLAFGAGLADGSPSEQAILAEQLEGSRAELAARERELVAARHAAAGVDLPPELDGELYAALPLEGRRHVLSSLLATVIVQPAAFPCQPVPDRATVLRRDQVPDGVDLLRFVAGLNVAPAAARVA